MIILRLLIGTIRFTTEFIILFFLIGFITYLLNDGDSGEATAFALVIGLVVEIILLIDRIKKSKKNSNLYANDTPPSDSPVTSSKNNSLNKKQSTNTTATTPSNFVKIPGALDHIRFNYQTKDLREYSYTVAVMRFSKDKFTGFCFERNGERSFFPDSIIDQEVIRVTTGEVLMVDQWLNEHNLQMVNEGFEDFPDVHSFAERVSSEWQSSEISVLSDLSDRSPYGTVGLYKKFKSGKPYKHPFLYLEARNSSRGYLVSGKCPGKSYSKLDDAARYFQKQAENLVYELGN